MPSRRIPSARASAPYSPNSPAGSAISTSRSPPFSFGAVRPARLILPAFLGGGLLPAAFLT
ncbi:hypothetical protein [Streptomyces sp. NPDC048637]|uniref:hypothetical protein n=1 Tax=Streptomyces sp. NPDC048637 TaxID=3155636 RepID=UPI003423B1E3